MAGRRRHRSAAPTWKRCGCVGRASSPTAACRPPGFQRGCRRRQMTRSGAPMGPGTASPSSGSSISCLRASLAPSTPSCRRKKPRRRRPRARRCRRPSRPLSPTKATTPPTTTVATTVTRIMPAKKTCTTLRTGSIASTTLRAARRTPRCCTSSPRFNTRPCRWRRPLCGKRTSTSARRFGCWRRSPTRALRKSPPTCRRRRSSCGAWGRPRRAPTARHSCPCPACRGGVTTLSVGRSCSTRRAMATCCAARSAPRALQIRRPPGSTSAAGGRSCRACAPSTSVASRSPRRSLETARHLRASRGRQRARRQVEAASCALSVGRGACKGDGTPDDAAARPPRPWTSSAHLLSRFRWVR
mmetsp:Transcript_81337/g.235862  ORF Transcript_81337/g.235862 Transcript_81337/m.235862 type:complete len:357 (-) Transcript_81337:41-1111(-)